MANVTIYDVAEKAGVSLATVSRVLNKPEKVAEPTRERVLQVIKELGYRPNMVARGLASKKTTTVGVITSDIGRAQMAQLLSGIIDIAESYNYSIKLFTIWEDFQVNDDIQKIIAEQVDGVLYLNDELKDESINIIKEALIGSDIPFVFANVATNDRSIPVVQIDYEKACYDITKKMIEEGRKNIYFITTNKTFSVNLEKEKGYKKAIIEEGLTPNIFKTSSDTSVNEIHFKEYFKNSNVDGAIAVRDSMAVSFMNTVKDFGKEVPKDISVCGMENTKYSVLSRPKLTAIDIPVYDIGAVAMRLLTKLLGSKTKTENTKVILPHTIIERKSTL